PPPATASPSPAGSNPFGTTISGRPQPSSAPADPGEPAGTLQQRIARRAALFDEFQRAEQSGNENNAIPMAESIRRLERSILAELLAEGTTPAEARELRLAHLQLLQWLATRYERTDL